MADKEVVVQWGEVSEEMTKEVESATNIAIRKVADEVIKPILVNVSPHNPRNNKTPHLRDSFKLWPTQYNLKVFVTNTKRVPGRKKRGREPLLNMLEFNPTDPHYKLITTTIEKNAEKITKAIDDALSINLKKEEG